MTDPTKSNVTPDADVDSAVPQATGSADVIDAASDTESVQRQLSESQDKYLRLAAEYDNFRRRAARERQESGWRAQGDLVRGLIDAIDDISRFAHVDPMIVDAKTVVEGVQMVERKVLKSLSGHGLELVNPLDHPFDPARHEAVSTTPAMTPEDDGLVAAVFQVGYVINGHLLRPARVVVKQWSGA